MSLQLRKPWSEGRCRWPVATVSRGWIHMGPTRELVDWLSNVMCAKVQSCSHPFVPIHSSSIPPHELALPLPIQGSLTPRALFPAAPCAVLPLHELSLPCCSLFSASFLSPALLLPRCGASSSPFMEWSRDGLEAARATSAALRASSQEWGRHAQRSRARARRQHGAWGGVARRKTVCIARCGC